MKLTSIAIGAAWVFAAKVGVDSGTIPQAVGFDPSGLLSQYLPYILGVIMAFINEYETGLPPWLVDVLNKIFKNNGADTDFGNKALEVYHKMLEILEVLKKDPEANAEAISNLRLALMHQHEEVVGYGPSED